MQFTKQRHIDKRYALPYLFELLEDGAMLATDSLPAVELSSHAGQMHGASVAVMESGSSAGVAETRQSGSKERGGNKPSDAAILVSPVNPSATGLMTTEEGGSDEFGVRHRGPSQELRFVVEVGNGPRIVRRYVSPISLRNDYHDPATETPSLDVSTK